jgi:cytochrome P450 family 3 subfamily A
MSVPLIILLTQMTPLVVDRCNTLESILAEYANTDKSIDMFDVFGKLTMETIVAAAFGRVIDVQRGEHDELVNAAKEITSEGREFSAERLNVLLSNFQCAIHILHYFASHSKIGAAYLKISKLALALIMARRESPDAQSHKDFLQLMLDATAEERGEQRRLTDEEVMSQSFIFIAAGYETTANLLTYTAYTC